MMAYTAAIFNSFVTGKNKPEAEFTKEYLPAWTRLDKLGSSMITRIVFGVLYTTIYIFFAPNAWWFVLLPVHFLMGPVQGAIVNWCGHKYGYSNYNNGDHSRNTSPWGILLMGELFQNNHHHAKNNANFARRWFEFDITFMVMKVLHKLTIIQLIPAAVLINKNYDRRK